MDQGDMIYKFFKESNRALLIVLDALRADIGLRLAELHGLKGIAVRSRGRWTDEWLLKTFARPLRVVYLSANPRVKLYFKPGPFIAVIDLARTYWSNHLKTVPPWSVNYVARKFIEEGVRKLLVHFLQPHPPFLVNPSLTPEKASVDGEALEAYRSGYKLNAAIALRYAIELAQVAMSNGFKVAITSDHGEELGVYAPFKALKWLKRKNVVKWLKSWAPYALGLKKVVGHPIGWPGDELRYVPWIEL